MPESSRVSPTEMSLPELRRYTACRLVRSVDHGRAIRTLRARKDVSRKVLWIYVEWEPDASNAKRSLARQNARALLERWVWDGWGVHFEAYERPR